MGARYKLLHRRLRVHQIDIQIWHPVLECVAHLDRVPVPDI